MKRKTLKERVLKGALSCLVIAALYMLPLFVTNTYVLRVCVYICIYAMLAIGLNLISGVCGQVSMGQAAFYGIGAYTSALLSMNFGLPWPVCMLLAAAMAGLVGFLIGVPALRLQGGYLVICTVGFNELVRLVLLNWTSLTRGPMGITNIARPVLFGVEIKSGNQYLFLALTLLLLIYGLLRNLIRSKFGRNLRAIKEDEIAAETMGIHVHRNKVVAFLISSAVAGVAGSLLAHYMLYISPSLFVGDNSTTYLSMVVLGGMGNMLGSVIAAAVLTTLPELLRGLDNYRMLIYGVLLIALMLGKTKDWSTTAIGKGAANLKRAVEQKLTAVRKGA